MFVRLGIQNLKIIIKKDCRFSSSSIISNVRQDKGTTELAYIKQVGVSPLVDMTMGQLFEFAAKEYSKLECLVSFHQGVRFTFSEFLSRADRLAAGLRKMGLDREDRIGIWSPNCYQWSLVYAAATRVGLIVCGINPFYTQSEIQFCIRKIGMKAVFAFDAYRDNEYAKMLLNVKNTCPTLEHIVIFDEDHVTGTRRLRDVAEMPNKKEIEAVKKEQNLISPYTGTNMQFTSGTTGNPKAVVLSHRSLVNNAKQLSLRSDLQNRKICLNVPYFHAFGMMLGIAVPFHVGATVVLESGTFNPVNSINAIIQEKCTVACGTPTMWTNMLDVQNRTGATFDTLEYGFTGGAASSPNLHKKMKKCMNFKKIVSVYGLTEATALIFQTLPNEPEILTETTVGCVCDHLEVKIIDEIGNTVPFDTPGELLVRGYSTMIKYWGDEKKTKEILLDDKWLKTGDQFILQKNGYGSVVGRLKDMLIRGGENIFPKEIEFFYETHPKIAEVHVVGVYDEVYGEEVCACIRLRAGENATKEEIIEYAKGKIARFKIPRYIRFCNEFPKTGSGKIQKHKLRQILEEENFVPKSVKNVH